MAYETIKSILVLLAILTAGAVFGRKVYRLLWVNLRRGQPSGPFLQWGERIRGLVVFVAGQFRLFRFLIPGTSHFFIFWGFLLLFPTILEAILEGLLAFTFADFSIPLLGRLGALALLQDIFGVLVSLAALYGLYLRLVVNPERYKSSHRGQGVMVLAFILIIMISLFVMNGARINLREDPLRTWRPVSSVVGSLFANLDELYQKVIAEGAYWIHLGVVLLFLTELPGGKHFHVVTSIPAVLLRRLDPPGRLPGIAETTNLASIPQVGVKDISNFRWRHMLDFYTCTECGRCQEVCPAYQSGMAFSPKLLMMRLRDHLVSTGISQNGQPKKGGILAKNPASKAPGASLIGDAVADSSLWACTTCFACDQECPLFIEHVIPIVEMRRYLVNEGHIDNLLQDALSNLGRYGNSFGQSERMRARWTQPLESQVKDARRTPVEYLWFLGDYASYNTSLLDITRRTAEVFNHVGLDFGILFDSERNAGNDVRRVGEEGLFEMLVERNSTVLAKCDFRALITTDPHSYNTLRNEYPREVIDQRPVLHYTELLDELISSSKLKLSHGLDYTVTYHDPCYLGRYNGVYDAPRRVIAATGCKLVEMPRHGDRALCCGAGGGRIWMEEGELKQRPSETRIEEAVSLDKVEVFAVACPKDVTMYRDAVKTIGHEKRLAVRDVIELVYEAL